MQRALSFVRIVQVENGERSVLLGRKKQRDCRLYKTKFKGQHVSNKRRTWKTVHTSCRRDKKRLSRQQKIQIHSVYASTVKKGANRNSNKNDKMSIRQCPSWHSLCVCSMFHGKEPSSVALLQFEYKFPSS